MFTGTPKRKSPADRARDERRSAARVQRLIEKRLLERREAWTDSERRGRDEFTVAAQDGIPSAGKGDDGYRHRETPESLAGLHYERRGALVMEARIGDRA